MNTISLDCTSAEMGGVVFKTVVMAIHLQVVTLTDCPSFYYCVDTSFVSGILCSFNWICTTCKGQLKVGIRFMICDTQCYFYSDF